MGETEFEWWLSDLRQLWEELRTLWTNGEVRDCLRVDCARLEECGSNSVPMRVENLVISGVRRNLGSGQED